MDGGDVQDLGPTEKSHSGSIVFGQYFSAR